MPKILMFFTCCMLTAWCSTVAAQYNGESQFAPVTIQQVTHTVAADAWEVNQRGHHRAVVLVKEPTAKAVRVLLPWRRPDSAPAQKRVVVVQMATGKEVSNVYVNQITNEAGSLAFAPDGAAGYYAIYYLPFTYRKTSDDARYGAPWNDYLPAVYHADKEWLDFVKASWNQLPVATVTRFEARKKEELFTPMGLIATREETDWLIAKAKGDCMLFPEDRAFPIRLSNQLPARWTGHMPAAMFEGEARPNEYYTFQLGVFAYKTPLSDVRVQFSDLVCASSATTIGKDSLTCFNQEGTGWNGQPVHFKVNVPAGNVQALWIGVPVPAKATAGIYEGTAIVTAKNAAPQRIKMRIKINGAMLADRGDSELWRHARLRWLNSTLGISDDPIPPFQSLYWKDRLLTASGKQVLLDSYGLPAQITTGFSATRSAGLLAAPVLLEAITATDRIALKAGQLQFQDAPGKISWTTIWTAKGLHVNCTGSMGFDGTIQYRFSLAATGATSLTDLRLAFRFAETQAPYMMGMGLEGGNLPALPYTWNWKGPWDSFWIGNVTAGLHAEFTGTYNGPLLNDYKPEPPPAWYNNGNGSVRVTKANGEVMVNIATGAQQLLPGKPLALDCKLLITPVKEIDTYKHFSERYYQGNPEKWQRAVAEGANVINVHHNTSINPYINYPFIVRDSLAAYIARQHAANRRVKLYYTIRELSNYAPEIYALKSLGSEIFPPGAGQGDPWLWEHLNTGYKAAWYAPFPDGTADASIVMNGFSRWINYYIEGLRWMLEQYHIDGLYLDDVAYDRDVIQRLRRVLLQYNPNALLDLHSNTRYSVGPANQYAAFFPYLDRLWFGESFQYNTMTPDQWLVQFSGIPFGVMSEMLQDDGNQWLGMVYGTSNRHSWGGRSPAALWKYWDEVNLKQAHMYGYWDQKCPVTSNNNQVKITVYEQPGKLLLAIGNFSDTLQYVLPQLRPGKKGFAPGAVTMQAVAIPGFQSAAVFTMGESIAVPPKKGWLIEISKQQ